MHPCSGLSSRCLEHPGRSVHRETESETHTHTARERHTNSKNERQRQRERHTHTHRQTDRPSQARPPPHSRQNLHPSPLLLLSEQAQTLFSTLPARLIRT